MMTAQEIAAKRTMSAEEHSALWAQFYSHSSNGCNVDKGHDDALLELIKTAPHHYRLKLVDEHEDIGMFAWQRKDDSIAYVGIFMTSQGDTAMMDLSLSDIDWYQRQNEAA